MAPRTRPTINDTSVAELDKEVHTYLFDNISLIADSSDTPSDTCPWLIKGASQTPSYNADSELSALQISTDRYIVVVKRDTLMLQWYYRAFPVSNIKPIQSRIEIGGDPFSMLHPASS